MVGEPGGSIAGRPAGVAGRRRYWWCWKLHRGQPVSRGPYTEEAEARERGMAELGGDFEVVELPTRDSRKAKGLIAEIILRRTSDVELALKRQRHQPVKEWDRGEEETY